MQTTKVELKKTNIYFPLLLSFILADEMCNNFIFSTFASDSKLEVILFIPLLLVLQIIAAPIQSTISDLYGRKKSLAISISFSLISLVGIFLYVHKVLYSIPIIIFIIIAKGAFGNTLPLSWAGIADTQNKNFRFSLGLSTAAIAGGYLLLTYIENLFGKKGSSSILMLLFIILLYFCVKHFKDVKDRKTNFNNTTANNPNHLSTNKLSYIISEIRLLADEFKQRRTRMALSIFLLWQISFYSVHILDIDLHNPSFSSLTATMMYGYLLGVFILKFTTKIEDLKMIKIGFYICAISVIPIFLMYFFINDRKSLILTCYFFYNLGTAFLPSSLFSILSKERKIHEQGKIYGLIDSTDTFAFLLSSILVLTYNSFKISPIYIILFSFLTFIASWIPYEKFNRLKQQGG